LASSWRSATAKQRRGARFVNGFEFVRRFRTAKDEQGQAMRDANGALQFRTVDAVFARVRRDDRHHVRYDMARAKVLDLATLTHTLTDRVYSLERACEAFGVPFDRPGYHDGTISEPNVRGCLYDVAKTSELLYAAGREYDRHPVDLTPWRAQSGASLAKAYLRAFGVAPRSIVQPDFSKEHQGIAATTYFGGRVECRILGHAPCVYIDAVSMYPTIFTLLNLWFDQVIPKRLEPEEMDPSEIQALLDEIHGDPRRLLDPRYWRQLAFFALVEPNSAHLPARPTIPSPLLSRSKLVALEAQRIFDEQTAAQAPFWAALDECGGKIVPDMVYDPKGKRWRPAGEFADIPRGLLKANRRRAPSGRVNGNTDRIAQAVRSLIGDADLTSSGVLEFFATHVRPSIEAARREAAAEIAKPEVDPAAHRLVSIGPLTSKAPLWFAGPDLAGAAIAGGGRPRILRAWRLKPEGVQATLQSVPFRGDEDDRIDPRTTNPWRRLVELRKRESGDARDDELRSDGYKVMSNSGAYGVCVETSPEDIDPSAERSLTRVHVRGLEEFIAKVDRPEFHSPLCSFPIAALVTAGARLLLAVAERLVRDAGGEVTYCDTDSLVIVATEHGGSVPCEYGPYVMADGRRAVRALSWAQVNSIVDDLTRLKVYRGAAVSGSSFKLEPQNFDETGRQRQLWFLGTREKSYALYAYDATGMPVVEKHSAHTIGQYSSPYGRDPQRRWIREAWEYTIRKDLGPPVDDPPWFDLPAISQLTLTTANIMRSYVETSGPFDFVSVAQLAYPRLLRCCEAPRPSCVRLFNLAKWAEHPWRCLSCGAVIDPYLADTDEPIFKTYRRVVASLAGSFELKRLMADGSEPVQGNARGLTIPRPVNVETIEHMGKEVIVDPTDTSEDLTAELLNATDPVVYRNASKSYDGLRARIRAAGVSTVARVAKVSRSTVQAFVNQGTVPQAATIAKLEAALEQLQSP
ncbi:MAG TPA: hypothetical protein VGX91_04020, partial [Candidatus Cybelea sp.]|nr:hypothetical protein [Candidatus Cybelea sp.]